MVCVCVSSTFSLFLYVFVCFFLFTYLNSKEGGCTELGGWEGGEGLEELGEKEQ